jgi:hypothetical protein
MTRRAQAYLPVRRSDELLALVNARLSPSPSSRVRLSTRRASFNESISEILR